MALAVRKKPVAGKRTLRKSLQKKSVGPTMQAKSDVIFEAASAPISGAVVWLHGFGDEPEAWAEVMEPMRAKHTGLKWVHPRAQPLPQSCYRGKSVPAWGNYVDEGCTHVGSADYENEGVITEASIEEVHRILERLQADDHVAPERIVLCGFSMGATAAAEIAVAYGKRLGGLVLLNGWLPPRGRAALPNASTQVQGLPVLISHSTNDEQVGFDTAVAMSKALEAAGAVVQFEEQRGLGHAESGFAGRVPAMKFLESVLCVTECKPTQP
mmetsp:Transcript_51001/g.119261  ORF Transcript_51001/g.119261 Transcript_51001/m.119261 type:complete len:269 (-) Transcript_51001:261-1067(-)